MAHASYKRDFAFRLYSWTKVYSITDVNAYIVYSIPNVNTYTSGNSTNNKIGHCNPRRDLVRGYPCNTTRFDCGQGGDADN